MSEAQAVLTGCEPSASEYSRSGGIPACVCGCGRLGAVRRRLGGRSPYATDACRARVRNRRIAELVALGARFAKQPALPGESRVERAFAAWVDSEDGRIVTAEVIRRARLLQARGFTHYGIAGLWEAIRYDFSLALKGEAGAWRLNNNFRSLLARKVMAEVPELRGFFEVRTLRGVR